MTKSRIVAGVELGSSKIATLISQIIMDPVTQETSVNVVGAASSESKGIKKGQIVDIDEATEATIASVEAAERMAGYNLESAYIALGGAHVHSQNSHGVVAISDELARGVGDAIELAVGCVGIARDEIGHAGGLGLGVDAALGVVGISDGAGTTGQAREFA